MEAGKEPVCNVLHALVARTDRFHFPSKNHGILTSYYTYYLWCSTLDDSESWRAAKLYAVFPERLVTKQVHRILEPSPKPIPVQSFCGFVSSSLSAATGTEGHCLTRLYNYKLTYRQVIHLYGTVPLMLSMQKYQQSEEMPFLEPDDKWLEACSSLVS